MTISYGSHRSHGEILAKGLSAIEKLPAETLISLMEKYNGGKTLKGVEMQHSGASLSTVKTLAIDLLALWGTGGDFWTRNRF